MTKEIINSFNSTPHTSLAPFVCPRGVLHLSTRKILQRPGSHHLLVDHICDPVDKPFSLLPLKKGHWKHWVRIGLSQTGICRINYLSSHLKSSGWKVSSRIQVVITERYARWPSTIFPSWKTYTQQVKILTLISGHKEDSSETWFSQTSCRPHLWSCWETFSLLLFI